MGLGFAIGRTDQGRQCGGSRCRVLQCHRCPLWSSSFACVLHDVWSGRQHAVLKAQSEHDRGDGMSRLSQGDDVKFGSD